MPGDFIFAIRMSRCLARAAILSQESEHIRVTKRWLIMTETTFSLVRTDKSRGGG
jgi:hypothetical protein